MILTLCYVIVGNKEKNIVLAEIFKLKYYMHLARYEPKSFPISSSNIFFIYSKYYYHHCYHYFIGKMMRMR